VAVRDRAGEYVALSGNEVGILLGHAELQRDRDRRRAGDGPPLVVTTIVSTPLLAIMAHDLGAGCELTLTGFKWIANRAMARERADGARFLFGFEEALGYTLGTAVRDKDGISAAVRLATLAAERHAEGESLRDELARIYRRYGLFASRQHNLELPGIEGRERMAAIMAALREHPPAEIGGRSVRSVSDYARSERRGADGSPSAIDLPPSDVLAFELDGGHRVVARPSGTEPKIKLYFDVREPLGRHEPLSLARARAAQRLDALVAALLARIEAR
jgi:phosphomannomutase